MQDEIHIGDAHGVEDQISHQNRRQNGQIPGATSSQRADHGGGGDQPQQKAEAGLKHIADAAALRKDRQAQQSDAHIEQLRNSSPLPPQQETGQGGKEKLQRNGHGACGDL